MSAPARSSPGPVALSLGSNMGDRARYLALARERLAAGGLVRILQASSLYETEPFRCLPQRWFLNQMLWVETGLSPELLLSFCQRVEHILGRRRVGWHAPRTVDIDILLFGGLAVRLPRLTLPHPALPFRRSILQPLAELEFTWRHPVLGLEIPSLLARCPDPSRVVLVAPGESFGAAGKHAS